MTETREEMAVRLGRELWDWWMLPDLPLIGTKFIEWRPNPYGGEPYCARLMVEFQEGEKVGSTAVEVYL